MAPADENHKPERVRLSERLLDHQLLDLHGVRCGRVDDVELSDEAEPRVLRLLTGPAAWPARVPAPFRRVVELFSRYGMQKVEWDDVYEVVNEEIRLAHEAPDLGLGRGDEKAARIVARLPMSH